MNDPDDLKPMSSFDPTQPAILHDRRSGRTITWTGDQAADFRADGIHQPDGAVAWRGMVIDGWGEVLGG
jgi:hypothetical protein